MEHRLVRSVSASVLAGVSIAAGGQAATTPAGTPAPTAPAANAIYDLTFRPAGSDGGGLRLCLRAEGERFAAGVTVGPLGPTTVDGSALRIANRILTGHLKATVGFDGYYPKDGKPVAHDYTVTAALTNGALRGAFAGTVGADRSVTGTVEGAWSAAPDLSGYWIMDLQMENGCGTGTLGPKSYGQRVYPKLYLKDGRFAQNLIYGWGGRVQINYFESSVLTNALRFDGKTLAGALTVKPTGGPIHVFTFDGAAVGTQLGGTFTKRVGGVEHPGGPFHGTLAPMPARSPDRAVHYLELHEAVYRTWTENDPAQPGLQLMASVPCLDGKFGPGVAYAAAWNHAFHDLDGIGLTLKGDTLGGTLKVTMHPDPYMPPDHKPVAATYAIEAKIVDGRIVRGAFTGTFKDRPVSGPIYGELLDQPPVPEPVAIHIKMEDGVNGGAPWHRRTWVNFTAVKGVAERGSMSNNKGGWKGTFKRAEIRFDGAAFAATVEGTVDESHGTEKGAYAFKLTGKAVGAQLIGSCDTYRDGKLTKSGTDFMGDFRAVEAGTTTPAP